MAKRKLEDLNLLDDFLFGSMVTHPKVGEEFVREILKTIFGKSFGKLTVVPQKVYYGADTDDKEVSLNYMKTFEWEEMLIKQGQEQGQLLEQANTERERARADFERKRADSEKERADHAEQEIRRLKEQLAVK